MTTDKFPIVNGPEQKYYKKSNKNIFFSYSSPSSTSFQSGYLGIGPSKISGLLHILSPESPLLAYRVQISLIGVEFNKTKIRKYMDKNDPPYEDDSKNNRNTFYKKTHLLWVSSSIHSSPKAAEVSSLDTRFEFKLDDDLPSSIKPSKNFLGMKNGYIKYFLVAEVHTQSKKSTNPNHQVLKSAKVEVPITRWSLPSEKLSSPGSETIEKRLSRKSLFACESILDQSSYDLNSTIKVMVMLLLPMPGLFIKEITSYIEETSRTESDEFPMVTKRKVALQKISGADVRRLSLSNSSDVESILNDGDSDTASIDGGEESHLFEVKLKVPSKEENIISPTMSDNPLVARRVTHKIKIKVKFNNCFRGLKIERNVEIRNGLSQKKIADGIAKGEIYSLEKQEKQHS